MIQTGDLKGGSGYYGNDFLATPKVFTGRNISEASKKMDKFLKDAQITGSFFLREN